MTRHHIEQLVRRTAAAVTAAALIAGPLASGTPAAQPVRTTVPSIDQVVAARQMLPMLTLESRGSTVQWVQKRVGATPDGIFGPRTRAAVVAFQKDHGLHPDGIVGPKTFAALRSASGVASAAGARSASASCIVSGPRQFRNDWGNPRSGGRRHRGNDVFAPYGAPIHAIADGVVVRSYSAGLGGLAVILRVGDVHYYYAHNSKNLVRAGQRVKAGEVIARVGNSGNARGGPAHVHFERWVGPMSNIQKTNPYETLRSICG